MLAYFYLVVFVCFHVGVVGDGRTSMAKCDVDSLGEARCAVQQQFENLVNWLSTGGALTSKVDIIFYNADYRGLIAVEDIASGEIILEIPEKFVLTVDVARNSEIGNYLKDNGCVSKRDSVTYLSAFLLDESHNEDSFWKPYIDMLPQTFDVLPIMWDESDLELLKETRAGRLVEIKKGKWMKQYQMIVENCPDFSYSYEEFQWAKNAVSSRYYDDVVVPLIDMTNNNNSKPGEHIFSEDKRTISFRSLVDIKAGEEIFDRYDTVGNSNYLLEFGFIEEHNTENIAVIHVDVPAWAHFLVDSNTYRMVLGFYSTSRTTKEIFALLRFFAGGPQQYSQMDEPQSLPNELGALHMLEVAIDNSLANYPTTFEHDETLLASDELDLTQIQRNAVTMRRDEKKMYLDYLMLCQTCGFYMERVIEGKTNGLTDCQNNFPEYFGELASVVGVNM